MKHIKTYESSPYEKHLELAKLFKTGNYVVFNKNILREINVKNILIIHKSKPYEITNEVIKYPSSNLLNTILVVENNKLKRLYSTNDIIDKVVTKEEGEKLLDEFNMRQNIGKFNI